MKISKHVHSCLLVENMGKTVLIDPGEYSLQEKAISVNMLSKLDAICYTHEHFDHFSIPFLKEVLAKFPNVQIFGTSSIRNILEKENIIISPEGNDFILLTPVKHEKIFMGSSPENVMITLFNQFFDPGDSLSFSKEILHFAQDDRRILALPIQAPWGSTTWAVKIALKVKPKVIIPIHDWHWNIEARLSMYDRLEDYFGKQNIQFLKPEIGQVFEV